VIAAVRVVPILLDLVSGNEDVFSVLASPGVDATADYLDLGRIAVALLQQLRIGLSGMYQVL
jgi:hypothetical protein